MINPIKKAYESFDNFMMYGANKSVHAWNWTTGKTKADLANLLLDGCCISLSVGAFVISPFLVIVTPPLLYSAHGLHECNERLDKLEQQSSENLLKNFEVESKKKMHEIVGFLGITTSIPLFITSNLLLSESNYRCATSTVLMGLGLFSDGASSYIMRTDYLPPRKNCLSRAKDKLIEIIRSYKTKPKLALIPT